MRMVILTMGFLAHLAQDVFSCSIRALTPHILLKTGAELRPSRVSTCRQTWKIVFPDQLFMNIIDSHAVDFCESSPSGTHVFQNSPMKVLRAFHLSLVLFSNAVSL